MISRTKQDWTVGQTVKVGFMRLTVVTVKLTPGDYKPDGYYLRSNKGKLYYFTPYNGLESADSIDLSTH
jgi:hypothetical protein